MVKKHIFCMVKNVFFYICVDDENIYGYNENKNHYYSKG